MRKFRYIAAGITIGILVLLLLAHVINTSIEKSLLEKFSNNAITQANIVSDAVYTELNAVNAIKDPVCSDEDIDKLRFIVFQSRYAADIGRTQNGYLICTAGWGKLLKPVRMTKPALIEDKDIFFWSNIAGILPEITSDIIGQHDTIFFIAPTTFSLLQPVNKQYNAVLTSKKTHLVISKFGDITGLTNHIIDNKHTFSLNEPSYATACSDKYDYCVTASTLVPPIFRQPLALIIALILGGAFIGGILGWLLAVHYQENASYRKQLKRAIKNKNFQMRYQPIVRLSDRKVIGAEALVRWKNEEGVDVSPEVFIKLAEELGIIQQITRIVTEKTLKELLPLLKDETIPFYVSINLSMQDLLDCTFTDFLSDLVDHYQIPHERIILEITERSSADLNLLRRSVDILHQKGYRFYIDDFGTGYSNIGYLLTNLKIEAVKIDRSFTCLIGTNTIGAKIVDQVFAIIKSTGIKLIVEGIETEEQLSYVYNIDDNAYGQGYLFARPISDHAIIALMNKQSLSLPV